MNPDEMNGNRLYEVLRDEFRRTARANLLESDQVVVRAAALSPEEAIGNPEHKDYPLVTGRERLMQAEFRGCFGQAFTDHYGDFSARLSDILAMELSDNFRRAVFVSSLNALLRYLGLIDRTVHCRDGEPPQCADVLLAYLKERFADARIAMVGLQPRMVERLSRGFELRVTDLDKDNIGTVKYATKIDGPEKTQENLAWCDLALVTGTTVVNSTLSQFITSKPTIFYGVTIRGPAMLLSLDHFCECGH